MKNIVDRLYESRQIELAKSILESNGYKVSKVNEASGSYEWKRVPNKYADEGDSKEFIYYEPAGTKDRRSVVYGSISYDDSYRKYRAEVVKYPEVIIRKYCRAEDEAVSFIEAWFSENMNESTRYKVEKMEEDTGGPRRYESEDWDEAMTLKAFPVGKDQIRKFRSYLKSKGFQKDGNNKYYHPSTGDSVYIDQTWYGNYHVEPNIKSNRRAVTESKSKDGWEYWEMHKDWKGPFEYPQYTKRYSDEIIGFIYPPYRSDNPRIESIEGYHAELYDEKTGDIIDGDDFGNMQDAQEYLDDLSYRYLDK